MNEDRLQESLEFNEPEVNEKEQKIKKERDSILSKISSYQLDTLTERVAWVLNNYPDSRNSDITLQIKYWKHFEGDIFSGNTIDVSDLYNLKRLTSISRARAKIQNTYNLFLADESVRAHRGTLELEERENAISESLFPDSYTVYADESGKTNKYLIVGSFWILNPLEVFRLTKDIFGLKLDQNFDKEFHFKEITKNNLNTYLKLADLVKEKSAFTSFKFLSLEKKGISNVQDAYKDLFYQLLLGGIKHEHDTGRARLPRTITFLKDREEIGSDKILMADLEDKLNNASKAQLDDKLRTQSFESVDSEGNLLIQITDLFTSSVNRVLNTWGDGSKPKDQFAKYFLDIAGINAKESVLESYGDKGVSINL